VVDKMEEGSPLIDSYVRFERLRGKRNIRKLPYLLKPLWGYLEHTGLALEEMNYQRAQDLQSYLATMEDRTGNIHYAASTVHDMMNTIRNFYEFLKKQGVVVTNPFNSIEFIQRGEALPRNLPDEKTMAKILENLRQFWKHPYRRERRRLYKLHVMAEVLYSTGLRLDELASVQLEDVDLEGRVLTVTEGKGGKTRKAYLNEYCTQVLKLYIQQMREHVNLLPGVPKLFGVKDGRNLDRVLNKGLKEAGAALGIPGFTSHAIRHTLGFHLLRRGCDLRYIQLVLGHDDMASTSLYTKVEKQDLRRELDRTHPRKFREIS